MSKALVKRTHIFRICIIQCWACRLPGHFHSYPLSFSSSPTLIPPPTLYPLAAPSANSHIRMVSGAAPGQQGEFVASRGTSSVIPQTDPQLFLRRHHLQCQPYHCQCPQAPPLYCLHPQSMMWRPISRKGGMSNPISSLRLEKEERSSLYSPPTWCSPCCAAQDTGFPPASRCQARRWRLSGRICSWEWLQGILDTNPQSGSLTWQNLQQRMTLC